MNNRRDFKKKEMAMSSSPYVYLPVDIPVYTVKVTHREEINGELLQQALERTLKRMPYLRDTIVEDHGAFWYAENPLPMEVAHIDQIRRVGGSETNYHMLDLTWDGNVTCFSMFHGFCDGQGINTFLESVLYHYYCLKDKKEYEANGIRTDKGEMTEAEVFEPYAHTYALPEGFVMPEKREMPAAYHIPECSHETGEKVNVLGFRLKSDELMAFVKENNTSPSIALSMLMGEAILRVHPEADAPIFTIIPISIRRMLGCEETFKNCSSRTLLPLSGTPMDAMPFAEKAAALRGMLKQQMNPNLFRSTYNLLGSMYRKRMEEAVSYAEELKKPAAFTGVSHDTFYLDYIGSMHPTDYMVQITDIRFLCVPAAGKTMHLNVIEHNGIFSIECLSMSEESAYGEALEEVLKAHGLGVQVEPASHFSLPRSAWRDGLGL